MKKGCALSLQTIDANWNNALRHGRKTSALTLSAWLSVPRIDKPAGHLLQLIHYEPISHDWCESVCHASGGVNGSKIGLCVDFSIVALQS
jgi:hypothetical protein